MKKWHGARKGVTIVRDPFESVDDFQISIEVSFPPVFSEVKRLLPGYACRSSCVLISTAATLSV